MSEAEEALEVMNVLLHHGKLILALDTAKTALKKQIPTKPISYKHHKWKCVCGAILDRNTKYCGSCGQALDLNEIDL